MFLLLQEQECQETSFGSHVESALSSPCSFMDPDFLMSLEEAYHPSPVSVLEPSFTEDTWASSEFSRGVTDNICSKLTRSMSGPIFQFPMLKDPSFLFCARVTEASATPEIRDLGYILGRTWNDCVKR